MEDQFDAFVWFTWITIYVLRCSWSAVHATVEADTPFTDLKTHCSFFDSHESKTCFLNRYGEEEEKKCLAPCLYRERQDISTFERTLMPLEEKTVQGSKTNANTGQTVMAATRGKEGSYNKHKNSSRKLKGSKRQRLKKKKKKKKTWKKNKKS